MKVRIHFILKGGDEDSIILSGSVEEIQESAKREMKRRGGVDCWSEILEEDTDL